MKEIGEMTHERIPQLPKMCPITHFFSKNVSRVDMSFDVKDSDDTIVDPLTDCVFTKLHVLNLF
jgi:hypothetical protein